MSHAGSFEIRRKSTHEQLRSNHIDTLYTLEKTLSENEVLRNQLQELQERFDKLSTDVQLATPTDVIINQLHVENSTLKTTVSEQSKKIHELETGIKTLQTSKAALEKKFNGKITEITYAHEDAIKRLGIQHATRYNMLSEDYTALLLRTEDSKSSYERTISALHEGNLSQEIAMQLQEELATTLASLSALQVSNKTLCEDMIRLREEHATKILYHETTQQRLVEKIQELEEALRQSHESCSQLHNRVKELQDHSLSPQKTFFATAPETLLFQSSSTSCLPRTPEPTAEQVPTIPPSTQEATVDAFSSSERFTFEEFVALKRENQALKLQLASLSDSIKKAPVNGASVTTKSSKHVRAVSANSRR